MTIELYEIPCKIKDLRLQSLDLEKTIYHHEVSKNDALKKLETLKTDIKIQIVRNPELKNETAREAELKKLINDSEDFLNLVEKVESLNSAIQNLNFQKTEISIDIECLKNILRVSDIEVRKAGV